MIAPPFLCSGDRIGVVATARKINRDSIETARRTFEDWGLVPVLSPYLFSEKHSYLAGDDEERTKALQFMLDDPTLKAIICARGGYGTTRILDSLNFTEFKKNPKWVIGFSDITALHLQLDSIGFQSVHGIMPVLFGREESAPSVKTLHDLIFGKPWRLQSRASSYNNPGIATGRLCGGNLSLIVDSLGTVHEPDTNGRILVIEEIEEHLYKVDRMMVQLKRSSKLQNLAGLVVGYFTDIKDSDLPFGETYQEIIRYHTREYNFPVAFDFPTGHQNPNHAWIHGGSALLKVGAEDSILTPTTLL
jgi:muramoyltetrapeptide carboxypeptidase